mgnify:CR=1 FL=1
MNTIQQAHILLVDDNTDLLRLLEEQLRGAGYQNIRTVQNCAAAQTAFAAEMPELMILDINLPDGDGFSLFRTLRAKADVPTLFLSARDADADRLFGLGLGADDYLTKPFLMQELLLRVQHLLQRAYRTELSRTKAAILQLGDRSVDLHDALVTLPDALNHAYTTGEVAGFARWYLDDYPVFCWAEDYGLFVIGLARGSLWKYSIYTSPEYILSLAKTIPLGFGLLLLLAAICCFLLSWQGAKRLETVASGLDALAEGQTVQLPAEGFAGELAEKLNRTSAQLQTRNELLARRDDARTQWIAGVSHDVRTPLALILGWAEQLERDAVLPETARQKAGGIRTQSEKLRTLIEDLNLTSKLEYGTQPLRKQEFAAGPLFRELVAQFCESPQAETCEVSLQQTAAAEQAKLCVDRALLERLLENLLGNSIRHNAAPVEIEVQTDVAGNRFCLTVADNGTGYPPAVLAALQGTPQNEQTPHILGLHVVEQIAAAHGGRVAFGQNVPNGAKATVWLPCAEKRPRQCS